MRILAVLFCVLSVAVLTCVGVLMLFHRQHEKQVERQWLALEKKGEGAFDPTAIADLPTAARRYLAHSIAAGTPLFASTDLRFGGMIRTAEGLAAQPLSADERLAPPLGYVWKVKLAKDDVTGDEVYIDRKAAIRYVRGGFLPATQEGDDADRSCRARLAIEHVLLPPSLLPSRGCRWTGVDHSHAVARLTIDGEEIDVAIEIADDDRLVRAEVSRWTPRRDGGGFEPVPFVLEPVSEKTFDGVTIPDEFTLSYRRGEIPVETARPRILEARFR